MSLADDKSDDYLECNDNETKMGLSTFMYLLLTPFIVYVS